MERPLETFSWYPYYHYPYSYSHHPYSHSHHPYPYSQDDVLSAKKYHRSDVAATFCMRTAMLRDAPFPHIDSFLVALARSKHSRGRRIEKVDHPCPYSHHPCPYPHYPYPYSHYPYPYSH